MMTWASLVHGVWDWQTLITGFLALGAAAWASRPVYKQLMLMQAQNNVMVRSTIGEMIVHTDAQANKVEAITSKPIEEMQIYLYNYPLLDPGDVNIEWISNQRNVFNTVDEALKMLFVASQDVADIEGYKTVLLKAVDQLNTVLWEVFMPEEVDRFPEDFNLTDEDHAKMVIRSSEAESEIESSVLVVKKAVDALIGAFARHKVALVSRLRVIDDSILAQKAAGRQ